jgi:hypothetical protein
MCLCSRGLSRNRVMSEIELDSLYSNCLCNVLNEIELESFRSAVLLTSWNDVLSS